MQRQFPNDCFGRFGDDLTELIADFLTIEDKFRFECLSRQWQRVVFSKARLVVIDQRFAFKSKNRVIPKRLTVVLKKCLHITSIEVKIRLKNSNKVYEEIVKWCPLLKTITFNDLNSVSEEVIEKFCQHFSERLNTIIFSGCPSLSSVRRVVQLCPHSSTSFSPSHSRSSDELEMIINTKDIQMEFKAEHKQELLRLLKRNKDTLKTININIIPSDFTENDYIALFDHLDQLRRLTKIIINYSFIPHTKLLVKFLKRLSENHQNIYHIGLDLSISDRDQFLRVYNLMNLFRNLKSLQVTNATPSEYHGAPISVHYLPKYCTNLVRFRLSGNLIVVHDDFFFSLGDRFQRLEWLFVSPFSELNQPVLNSIAGLPNLRSLRLRFNKLCVSNPRLHDLVRICRKLSEIILRLNGIWCELNDQLLTELRTDRKRLSAHWIPYEDSIYYFETGDG